MDVEAYLHRIGLKINGLAVDLNSLRALQRSHLLSVPFENLDIHWKWPIVVDSTKFFDKIVNKKRGGFCYELNGLFNELLRYLGFKTRLISARVFNGKEHGPEFDHAAILVDLAEGTYLADVGFGEFAAEPLRFVTDEEQKDPNGIFTITRLEGGAFDVRKKDGESWVSQYIFVVKKRELSEFSEMCDFQQYSPESHFTKKKICSIMTDGGRKTLTGDKFIVTSGDLRTETPVNSEKEFEQMLAAEFGIESYNRSDGTIDLIRGRGRFDR
jgi:N-hydroxyarylamine O-acetyltransferase